MIYRIILFVLLPFFLVSTSCQNTPANENVNNDNAQRIINLRGVNSLIKGDTIPAGDVNGDGIVDTAYLFYPEIDTSLNDCIGNCNVKIMFSCPVPPIIHEQSIGGFIYPIGDLDGNITGEILYFPEWFTSCWSAYFVYYQRDGKWKKIAASYYSCADEISFASKVKILKDSIIELEEDELDSIDATIVKKKIKVKLE